MPLLWSLACTVAFLFRTWQKGFGFGSRETAANSGLFHLGLRWAEIAILLFTSTSRCTGSERGSLESLLPPETSQTDGSYEKLFSPNEDGARDIFELQEGLQGVGVIQDGRKEGFRGAVIREMLGLRVLEEPWAEKPTVKFTGS